MGFDTKIDLYICQIVRGNLSENGIGDSMMGMVEAFDLALNFEKKRGESFDWY